MDKITAKKIIFDQKGTPSLSIIGNKYLFSFACRVYAGYIENDRAHDFNGSQRGWFDKGILRDLTGKCVGFVRGANGKSHPKFPPIKQAKEIKTLPKPPLIPVSQEQPFTRPAFQKAWANKNPTTLMIP